MGSHLPPTLCAPLYSYYSLSKPLILHINITYKVNFVKLFANKKLKQNFKKVLTKENNFGIISKSSERTTKIAGMAQSVEHVIGNDEVTSSNLVTSSKKSNSKELDFFIHCESGGISSRDSAYIIAIGVYYQPNAVYSFAMIIYNSFGIDYIHAYGVIGCEMYKHPENPRFKRSGALCF